MPLLGGFVAKKPATPGADIAARIVTPAAGSSLQAGQLVFGTASNNPFAAGGLAEYATPSDKDIIAIPDGVDPIHAAGIPIAGLTALQGIQPYVKAGDRVFINGGSGGVGLYAVQIAKILGCHVTTSCSGRNTELVKSHGADIVVDYTAGDLPTQLADAHEPFDHFFDCVGSPPALFFRAHEYSKPSAQFIEVAGSPSLGFASYMVRARLLPGFLGGGKRKMVTFFAEMTHSGLTTLVEWMQQGKLRTHIDSRHAFEQAPEAIRRQKTGRAQGKIIVDVEKPGL